MAINAQTTLRRLVWELEQWADAHKMIEGFGYGKYLDYYASETDNTYPALVVNCPNFTTDEWYFNFAFEFVTLDWVFDGRLNHDRATSNTAELMRDLENTMRNSKRWQAFARLDTEWSGRHLDEFGGDKSYGWLTTCVIKIKKRSGICKIEDLLPEYDFENQTPIIPACLPVNLTFNGSAITSTPSGGTKAIIVQNDAGVPVQVGTPILDNAGNLTVEVPAAGADITSSFNGVGTATNTPSGQNLAINVLSSAPAFVGTLVSDLSNTKNITIADSVAENSDQSVQINIPATATYVMPDDQFDVYLDTVLQSSVTDPVLTNTTINILWT